MSGEGRKEGLKAGVEMCRRFPVTGVGLGNFVPYRMKNLDGSYLVAHNTIGGVLGETGLFGGVAFLLFVSGVFVNRRKTKLLANMLPHPQLELLANLTTACRDSMIVLLFCGMFGDVQGRAQLYWVPAFSLLASGFAVAFYRDHDAYTAA